MDEHRLKEKIPIRHDYQEPIPENPKIKKTERGGFIYHELYFNQEYNCTVTLDQKVRTFAGQPKIVLREGPSKFGPEFIFQNCITNKIGRDPYPASTLKCYPTEEIYLPADARTIHYLRAMIRIFTKELERMGIYATETND